VATKITDMKSEQLVLYLNPITTKILVEIFDSKGKYVDFGHAYVASLQASVVLQQIPTNGRIELSVA
jgi:hypothetical protein